ncbi:MAG: hypothetical protein KDA90_22870 [Planctomycetaceae bacterium]|nr:hypothetical protein [Planctomycetaceae bacterium]
MQPLTNSLGGYKKRLRIFSESQMARFDHNFEGGFTISTESAGLNIVPLSRSLAQCKVSFEGITRIVDCRHDLLFDLVDSMKFPAVLSSWPSSFDPVSIEDMLNEYGLGFVAEFCRRVSTSRREPFDYGGNRILISYYPGILVLRDDVGSQATGVFDFSKLTSLIPSRHRQDKGYR